MKCCYPTCFICFRFPTQLYYRSIFELNLVSYLKIQNHPHPNSQGFWVWTKAQSHLYSNISSLWLFNLPFHHLSSHLLEFLVRLLHLAPQGSIESHDFGSFIGLICISMLLFYIPNCWVSHCCLAQLKYTLFYAVNRPECL